MFEQFLAIFGKQWLRQVVTALQIVQLDLTHFKTIQEIMSQTELIEGQESQQNQFESRFNCKN